MPIDIHVHRVSQQDGDQHVIAKHGTAVYATLVEAHAHSCTYRWRLDTFITSLCCCPEKPKQKTDTLLWVQKHGVAPGG